MSLTTIRSKIKTYIQSATSLNKTVYDYKRLAAHLSTKIDTFKENGIIHTWDVSRVGFEREHQAGHGGVVIITHEFLIRGYYGLNDTLASEKTFNDTIDLVCNKFEDNPKLEGEAQIVQPVITGVVMEDSLVGVLCHKAEITLFVQQRRTF